MSDLVMDRVTKRTSESVGMYVWVHGVCRCVYVYGYAGGYVCVRARVCVSGCARVCG